MGKGRLDLPDLTQLNRDDSRCSEPLHATSLEIFDIIQRAEQPSDKGARARRQLDFLESLCRTTPSTFSAGIFQPWVEGAGDVVVLYGTPLFSQPESTWCRSGTLVRGGDRGRALSSFSEGGGGEPWGGPEKIIGAGARVKCSILETEPVDEDVEVFTPIIYNETGAKLIDRNMTVKDHLSWEFQDDKLSGKGRSSSQTKRKNKTRVEVPSTVPGSRSVRVMRKIHIMSVNVPHFNGFASGQTAAEAALTRGRELWYAPYVKPACNTDKTRTSMEGLRAKAAEPFDNLALRDFRTLDEHTLAKLCHHHHYGLDGLVTCDFYDRERTQPVPPGFLKDRFPFSCQSDRRPFPPTRQGRIQASALVEMGALPAEAL